MAEKFFRPKKLFDVDVFRNVLKTNEKLLYNAAIKSAQSVWKKEVKQFMNDFHEHNVTREIEERGREGNISGTLDGLDSDGGRANLWGFIGFKVTERPISKLRTMLRNGFKKPNRVKDSKLIKSGIKNATIRFTAQGLIPNIDKIYENTHMEWEEKSWVEGVEKTGISGIGRFMYRITKDPSRSHHGIQSPIEINHDVEFKTVEYIASMLEKFFDKDISKLK